MAGVTLEFTFDDEEFRAALAQMTLKPARKAGILRAIGVGLVHTTQDRFGTGRGPDGTPWAPLNPAYAAGKRGGSILVGSGMSGGLLGSVTFATGADAVQVGSNKVYAAVHQFGATIRPVRAQALVFRLGDRLVQAQSVTIPARPYLGFGPAEEEVVQDALGVLLPGGR